MKARRWGWLWVALFLVALAACSGTAGESTTTSAPTSTEVSTSTLAPPTTTATTTTIPGPHPGGEVVIGDVEEPITLNPFLLGGDTASVTRLARAWTCGTQEMDGETGELVPGLVEELPAIANGGITLNPDGTETVHYRLRPEAVWEDGTPVSGYDYEFTYRTIMDPRYDIDRRVYEDILPDSIIAGPKTFEFALSGPTLDAGGLFALILPRHQIEGTDLTSYDRTGWLSCGPFRVDSWEPGIVRLERNENYWKTDDAGLRLPYLDAVTVRFYPDWAGMLDGFRRREAQIITLPEDPEVVAELRALEDQGARVDVAPGPTFEHLVFQFGENRLLRNSGSYATHLNFRRAVAHALDRELIADVVLGGLGQSMPSYVDAFIPSLSGSAWEQYDYDPARAREYLAALCDEDGVDCAAVPPKVVFTTTFNSPARVALSQLLLNMFEGAGLTYEAELEDSVLFFGETLDLGTWDLGEWSSSGGPSLADLVSWHALFDPDGPLPAGRNYARWGTPEVTGTEGGRFDQPAGFADESTARFAELWDLMSGTVDEGELAGYLAEAESILADQVVLIPLYQRPDAGAVWADMVGGYRRLPVYANGQGGDTWNIALWYRAGS